MTYPHGYPAIIAAYGNPIAYVNEHRAWEDAALASRPLTHPLPYAYGSATITRITAHHLVVDAFVELLAKAVETGCDIQRLAYGGCYSWRAKRMSTQLSLHTWGVAIDLDPAHNIMGKPHDPVDGLPMPVIELAERMGMTWGGIWTVPDSMHIECASGY